MLFLLAREVDRRDDGVAARATDYSARVCVCVGHGQGYGGFGFGFLGKFGGTVGHVF